MVYLDGELALPLRQLLEHLLYNSQNLCVGQHRIKLAGNIEVALIEFAHATFRHGRLIPSIYLRDMVSLDILDSILSAESCKWNGQVVSQGADLTTLVGEVIYELAVFAVFAGKRLL